MKTTLVFAAVLAFCASGCRDSSPVPEPESNTAAEAAAPVDAGPPQQLLDRDQKGKPAPAAEFLAPDGSKVTLATFKGKPLLLNLWATWCGPCVTEMPQLDQLAGSHKDLQVLTVSQDRGEEGKKSAQDFFAEKKFGHIKAYVDPEMKLTDAFEVVSMPTTILFDKDGKEVWRLLGPEEWTSKKAAELIAEGI